MSKQLEKTEKVVTQRRRPRKSLTAFGFECIVNGYAINYSLVTFDDSTIDERGLPAGMQSKPSMIDLMLHAQREGKRK